MNSARKLAAEAVAIIEEELQRRISLAELAERLHYSPYYLQRAFVEAVGLPPARYAQRRRLTEAALQLCYTRRPLADIALAAGYESQQAFTAAFAAFYKQPPRAFREEGRFYPLQLRHRPRQLSARGARRFGAVRPAQREDIPAWTELAFSTVEGFPHLEEEGFARALAAAVAEGRAFLLPTGEGELAGAVILGRAPGWIDYLTVSPHCRRRGAARAMLRFAAARWPGSPLYLTTFRAGDRADPGYRVAFLRLGFVEGPLRVEFGYPTQQMTLFPPEGRRRDG